MTADRRSFLDVRKSANGVAWAHRLSDAQERNAIAMAQAGGVSDIVARILAGRGVTPDAAEAFLDPTIRDLLPDPSSLTDMDRAGERIAAAIMRKERVAIFGDYDVDGAASSALLKRFLAHYGVEAEIYIPDRIFEGYGPNPDAMRELAGRAALIVTVDCGTNSAAAIEAARQAGADVVVLDHHQVGSELPPGVPVVNPNRDDDLSGQGHLCAAGVVFLALVHVSRLMRAQAPQTAAPDLLGWLDLVALATVCDVVALTGVNRAFVVKGLVVIRQLRNPGIAALAKLSRIGEPINAFHLGFLIGPRINAGGRIGDAALGSRLLATDDPAEAEAIAETLNRLNGERQAMEQVMLAEARAEADAEIGLGQGPAVLVTGRDNWHPGIAGLLASRLKDHARRPAFAIAFGVDGMGTGSGRSVPGFDLGKMVREAAARGLIVKGGGHAMAAGITVERSKLGALRAFFEERAAEDVFRLRNEECLHVDAALSADGATPDLLDAIDRAGPFGAGHAAPVFVLPRHRLLDVRGVGANHLRTEFQSDAGGRIQAMAFRSLETPLGDFLNKHRGRTLHVAGTLSCDTWNGNRRVQFRILDASLAG